MRVKDEMDIAESSLRTKNRVGVAVETPEHLSAHPSAARVYYYEGLAGNALRKGPRLIIDMSILPYYTATVPHDGVKILIQRWYDVMEAALAHASVKSISFVPDGEAKLLAMDGSIIAKVQVRLDQPLDGLAVALATIEKKWEGHEHPANFWSDVIGFLLKVPVPEPIEPVEGVWTVSKVEWLELCLAWVVYLAQQRVQAGQVAWAALSEVEKLLSEYLEAWNNSPSSDAKKRNYVVNRERLKLLLKSVNEAKTNDEKKHSLEFLAEDLLRGIPGFEILKSGLASWGEYDRAIINNSLIPSLQSLGSPILVEAKNWSAAAGVDVVGACMADVVGIHGKAAFLLT